jgi:hypothetical protein
MIFRIAIALTVYRVVGLVARYIILTSNTLSKLRFARTIKIHSICLRHSEYLGLG